MFSQPMTSPLVACNFAYRGVTLMTFEASRLTVFAITPPQPSRKARLITLRLVPGGPEPMTKGLGSFRPSTVVASVGMGAAEGENIPKRRSAQHEGSQSTWPAIPRAGHGRLQERWLVIW